ncbi:MULTISPECIES: low temperature requirement protein A [unclassified Micromonospora]|uniref:low temperature requirement protein A n=1 Tax=unclassified Micromonospora TaxID=2617518 RepID=UPI000EF554A4|nr:MULTISPECIES: low temperature requirement protein A [unclassified Micromonospora]RLP91364.1 low temperature requirement protein A [Micromonospora sp. BL4]RLP93981.1 low temperature requirement protein A [Micromonospora sp. CV4]
MKRIFQARPPVPTEEAHRTTPFEVFFDLVFVFAFIQVATFTAQAPTPLRLAHSLVLLLLLWWPFTNYAWLANQVRADVGLVRAGNTAVMAAMFVAALVLPQAWRHDSQSLAAPMTLALVYIVIRAVYLALVWHISAGNARLRASLRLRLIPVSLGFPALLLGAVFGGATQTLLWTAAFLIDCVGGLFIAVSAGRAPLPSPGHFAERHGLIVIIALGESLIAVGVGAGSAVIRWPVLIAALLALTTALTLWWLYFENAAAPAGQALARIPVADRTRTGSIAYSLTHFVLIAGIIYLAVGIEVVLAHMTHHPPRRPAGTSLDWTSTAALLGGPALYLVGRALFLRLTVRHTPPAPILAAGIILALLPVARHLPALAALALVAIILIALVCYERITWQPTAAAK